MSRLELLKKLCKEKGITINKLEQELEFSQGSLGKIDTNVPKADKLYALAKFFDIPMEMFFEGESAKRGARELEQSIEDMNRLKEAVGGEENFKKLSDELEAYEARQKSVHETADFMVRLSADAELYALVERVLNGSSDKRDKLLQMAKLMEI